MSQHTVAVIGIGAMGGGMAAALLRSDCVRQVQGFDQNEALVEAFHEKATVAGKAAIHAPRTLSDAVQDVDYCVIMLQTEAQCEAVCFSTDNDCLLHVLAPSTCVILCSTVTAAWVRIATQRFLERNIDFIDCPVSGGPARAANSDLTLMVSGTPVERRARPILNVLGSQIHVIAGAGPGAGMMVKTVHQLLAGVHICVAAEALALGAAAGLDLHQLVDIVNGAAGASWMFADRGPRMLEISPEIKSQVQIFVKDLDIVHAEAKRVGCPIPLASAALQQFVAATSLGLAQQDDSQVVKVYDAMTGRSVCESSASSSQPVVGDRVGDVWLQENGVREEILEVAAEPWHNVMLSNQFVRALRVAFPPHETTRAHRHDRDSLYFFLVADGGLDVINHIQGAAPACDCMAFGEVRFGEHEQQPLIHKITNKASTWMLAIDAEILQSPPRSCCPPMPLVAPHHELIKTRDKVRVYKLTLDPGERVHVCYPFFGFSVILHDGMVEKESAGSLLPGRPPFPVQVRRGDVAWHEPHEITKTNVGNTSYVEYIAEWR